MKKEKFDKLSKEEQQEEIERCKSFEYFYNNYVRKEWMPEFSEKVWETYVENVKKVRFSRHRDFNNSFYPFTPEECFKKKSYES